MLQVVFVAKLGVFYSQPEEEMLNTAVVPVESSNNQLTRSLHLLLCQDPMTVELQAVFSSEASQGLETSLKELIRSPGALARSFAVLA